MMRSLSSTILGIATLCGATAHAQGRHVFDVDAGQSTFSFSGTAALSGLVQPIVGNPSTFQVSGASDLDLTVSGSTLVGGQFVRGSSVASIPALSAIVPNVLPFLPPLATVNVSGVTVVFRSVDPGTLAPANFAIAANGTFSTTLVADILSGDATITALGSTQMIPLAGTAADPQPVSGTITSNADGFALSVPINSTFSFADPATGASGTLNLTGTVNARDRALASDVDTISIATGGTQTLTLSAGTAYAGEIYLLLGTLSGTSPGFDVNGVHVPLNPDSWLFTVGLGANVAPFGNTAALLDGLGVNTATITLPPLSPAALGLLFHHAYIVVDGTGTTVIAASNPVPLTLVN